MQSPSLGRVALAFAAASLLAGPVSAGDDKPRESASSSQVSPAVLPKGTPCTLRLHPEQKAVENRQTDTIRVTYEGKVAEATDAGVKLIVTEELTTIRRTAPGSGLPYLGRLFTSNGITHRKSPPGEEPEVWVPVEKIQAITLTVSPDPGTSKPTP